MQVNDFPARDGNGNMYFNIHTCIFICIHVYLNNSYKRLSVNEVTLMMLLVNWLPLFLNWNRLGSADAACYSRQRPLAS